MDKIVSEQFGELSYCPEQEIHFPGGLPAFEEEKRFVLVELDSASPLVFLQSPTRPDLSFVTLPVLSIVPEYTLSMTPEDLAVLELPPTSQPTPGIDVLCLAIVTFGEGREPTANLMAPVVVHLQTRCAVQAIQPDCVWSHQHKLPLG